MSGLGHLVLAVICLSSLLILLTFPIERVHQFGVHFRTGEVRRMVERDIPQAFGDSRPLDPRARHEIVFALAAIPGLNTVSRAGAPAEATEIPSFRLLSRLKLCSHNSGDSDSLS